MSEVRESQGTAAAAAGPSIAPLLSDLRRAIRSGEYPAGTWLPTERVLAEEYSLPRRAVQRAVDILAEEGLLVCRPRSRPIVATPGFPGAGTPAEAAATRQAPSRSRSRSRWPAAPETASSRLIALVMWHGDPEEQGVTTQQRIFWGMNRRLAEDGYHGVFLDLGATLNGSARRGATAKRDLRSSTEKENGEREATYLQYVLDRGFAGVVFYPYAYRRNRALMQQVAARMPTVLIDRLVPGVQADSVGIDNYSAEEEATRHLLALGHRNILFVTTLEPINTVQDRLEGYRQAMADAPGGPLLENVIVALSHWSTPSWPAFEAQFRLPAPQRPTAILCINDHTAMNVCRRLMELGLRVPEDVSVCGFDDNCAVLPNGVGLTTVAQPFEEIGSAAAALFLSRQTAPVTGCPPSRDIQLPAQLVVRGSAAAPRAA